MPTDYILRNSRCGAYARRGTGYGICDKPLDEHGRCPYSRHHVDDMDPMVGLSDPEPEPRRRGW